MNISSHLGFDGNCEEAMKFYESTFGGTITFKMTWAESPMCGQVGENAVRREFQVKILLQEQVVHQCDNLDHQLILAKIVTCFENDGILAMCL